MIDVRNKIIRKLIEHSMSDIMILLHTNQWSLVTKGTTPSLANDAGVEVGKENLWIFEKVVYETGGRVCRKVHET